MAVTLILVVFVAIGVVNASENVTNDVVGVVDVDNISAIDVNKQGNDVSENIDLFYEKYDDGLNNVNDSDIIKNTETEIKTTSYDSSSTNIFNIYKLNQRDILCDTQSPAGLILNVIPIIDENGDFIVEVTDTFENTVNNVTFTIEFRDADCNVIKNYVIASDEEGVVKISTIDFPENEYNVTISFEGNKLYDSISKSICIYVPNRTKTDTKLSRNSKTVYLSDRYGNPIAKATLIYKIFKIDDDLDEMLIKESTSVTDNDGGADIPTRGIPKGSHICSVYFIGNNQYASSSLSFKLSVSIFIDENIGEGSFSELGLIIKNATEGSVVNLTRDYTYNASCDAGYKQFGIGVFVPSITINGNGHIINGNNLSRSFEIFYPNVTIKNLTCINGYANYTYAGAISLRSVNCTIINCTFKNNYAMNYAGAIYCEKDNVTINDCIFINNRAYKNDKVGHGGAIDIMNINSVMIDNCIFINNSAANSGGAISTSCDNLIISECTFINNSARTGNSISMAGKNGKIINSNILKSDIHNSSSIIIESNPVSTTLTTYDVTVVYGDEKCLVAILKDNKGRAIIGATVSISIGNSTIQSITDYNGQVFISPKGITPKVYAAIITFGGNANYEQSKNYSTITVKKINPQIIMDDFVGTVGQELTITANVVSSNNNFTINEGSAMFYIDEKYMQSVQVVNGFTSFLYTPLAAGNHTMKVVYGENSYFMTCEHSVNFAVNKIDSNLTVSDIIFDYDDVGSCIVLFDGASGVTAKIPNHEEAIVNVNDNTITVSNLNVGNYTLTVTTIPDANHKPVTKTANITVNKIDSYLSFDEIELYYGISNKVNITTEGAIGIIAEIDGKNVTVIGNVIVISDLDVGLYFLTITTIPDENHNAAIMKDIPIPVNRVNSFVNLTDVIIDYGKITNITVTTEGVTGIIAKIDNNNAIVNVNTITIPVLNPDTYTLTVTTIPDANHDAVTKTANITVNKMTSQITLFDINSIVGQEVIITANIDSSDNLTVNEGNITFFDGETMIYATAVRNGVVTVPYIPTTAGEHIISIDYHSLYYQSLNEDLFLTVGKASVDLSIDDIEDAYLNNASYFVVNADSNFGEVNEGKIYYYVNGTFVGSSNIINGLSVFEYIPNIPGTFILIAAFEESDNFKASNNVTTTFTVFGVNNTETNTTLENITGNSSDINVTIEPEIVIPELDEISNDSSIPVTLPSDATGTVTLTVGGKDYNFDVVDGKADVKLPELDNGDYPYTITYSGDSKYSSFVDSGSLKVNNTAAADNKTSENKTDANDTEPTVKPDVVIPPLDNPSSDGLVTISLPTDATGKVTLTINGKDYNYLVENGVANVIIPNLGDGDYPYTITYSGDSKYSSFSNTGSLKVNKTTVNPVENQTNTTGNASQENTTIIDNSKIVASNKKVTYATGKYYTIKVYGEDGQLANGVKVVITVKGKTFKILTTKDGVAKFKITQKPGTYKMTINALNKNVTKTLTVKHLITLKAVTVKKSSKKLTLQASLGKVNGKYLKNKKITFKFNGKKYTAKTNKKGVAKVTIKSSILKKLKVGKKVTYQATYLKDTVKKTVKVKK